MNRTSEYTVFFLYSVIVKALDYFSTTLEVNFSDMENFNNHQVKNFGNNLARK